MTHPTRARSFGPAAADYDRYRPRYPQAALRWALDGPARPARVVDLAAGTGILTRGLLALGHEVTTVEPDPGMRAHLVATTPGVRAEAGAAEAMPLPDGYAAPS
ncbi:class I SAM-dependent methyltransferase [Micromonospora sp. NPDC002389]|uniref:class I SAM-dependent methyltransferase n=1 Tax=Micromonospora sp. NPDC002389 TaxID=3154272 RepID=UPI003323B63C